jgi:hypothetical protein
VRSRRYQYRYRSTSKNPFTKHLLIHKNKHSQNRVPYNLNTGPGLRSRYDHAGLDFQGIMMGLPSAASGSPLPCSPLMVLLKKWALSMGFKAADALTLIIDLHLVLRFRMCGAMPRHPHMPSWRVQRQIFLLRKHKTSL